MLFVDVEYVPSFQSQKKRDSRTLEREGAMAEEDGGC